jgi:hypothetical protein
MARNHPLLVTLIGLVVILACTSVACSGGGGGGPTGLQNQSPTISLAMSIESENGAEAVVRIVGSATDPDGAVTGIACEGQFSGTFGATFNLTRTVGKLAGMSQNFGTTCVATDDQGATASATGSVSISAAPLSFSGVGERVTQLFSLQGGFVTFEASHNGNSNFIVRLRNAQGQLEELIVNEIGPYDGTRGFGLEAGQYLLDIDADGAWEVTIREPRPASGSAPPLTAMGSGDAVVGPLQLSAGLARFTLDHTGPSNFIVWLWRSTGQREALLANEIGNAHAETAENIPASGLYYLDVQAGGSWTISIQ